MKAIFVTGGKQYMVEEGQELYVEKLNNEVDSEVVFDEVLYRHYGCFRRNCRYHDDGSKIR